MPSRPIEALQIIVWYVAFVKVMNIWNYGYFMDKEIYKINNVEIISAYCNSVNLV